jgi:hypothetical protein
MEHGNHVSPNLVDGKLIYAANLKLLALDTKTGKELWRNSPDDWQNGGHGSNSPLVVKIGGASAILQMRYYHRATDGTVICPSLVSVWGVLTPIVENGVVFNPCQWRGWKDPVSFLGIKPPASMAPGVKPETVMDLDGKDVSMPVRMSGPSFTVASPLCVDGVVYSIEAGGGLAAVETPVGGPSSMPKLEEDYRALFMHGVDRVLPAFGHFVRVDARRLIPAVRLFGDGLSFLDEQARRTPLSVVFRHESVRQACNPGPRTGHGGQDYSVG